MTMALRGLKVEVKFRFRVMASVRNAVGRTSILHRGNFSSLRMKSMRSSTVFE